MIRPRRLVSAALAALLVTTTAAIAPAAAEPAISAVQADPGPPAYPEYWFGDWDLTGLWALGARGQGVTIAEIDTGVNAALPELRGNVLSGKDFSRLGGDGGTDRDVSAFGHGTAMASIMVAQPGAFGITGVAPDAKVLPLAVPIMGTTASSNDDRLPDAITYAADHGAKIISMSLGGDREPGADQLACPTAEQDAITYAISKGAIVVASAGNGGQKGSPAEDPGVCLGVVSVGAVDSSGTVASFSSRERYLTVTAPGVQIASLGRLPNTAFSGEGTSQAAAITSAVLALIWSYYPDRTARQIVSRLLWTLDDRQTTRSTSYGYGRVNAQSAILATVPASAPNPVYDAIEPYLHLAGDVQPSTPLAVAAAVVPSPPGRFVVGSRASAVSERTKVGLFVVAGGVALLLVAAALLLARRRRRPSARRGPPLLPTDVPGDDPSPGLVIDALAWHEIAPADEVRPVARDR